LQINSGLNLVTKTEDEEGKEEKEENEWRQVAQDSTELYISYRMKLGINLSMLDGGIWKPERSINNLIWKDKQDEQDI
jgi:hypothetical protein